jgi:hypothetical protein
MFVGLLGVSDYKLTDMLSSAGATIGIIIAGTIFLQFLSTKYMDLGGRYRALTQEYRGGNAGESRHGLLQQQIRRYRCRLRLIDWASWLAAVSLMCFVLAVIAGGFSMAYPHLHHCKWFGTGGLLIGLTSMGVAVFLELVESVLARHELSEEIGDLDDAARNGPY